MATPSEKLAEVLEVLRELQEKGMTAIKSEALSRTTRERLQDNGFIKKVYKGWYMMIPPDERQGDSTSWYSSFWKFCAQLLEDKYGSDWCISPEQSLLLHAGNWTVPTQLIVKSPEAGNFKTDLPFDTSLFHIKSALPAKDQIIVVDGVRMLSLPSALIQASPTIYTSNPTDVRTALAMIKDASEVLEPLLSGGHTVVAGRLAGGFRNIGQDRIADNIIKTMQKATYDTREATPFEGLSVIPLSNRNVSPYVNRIKLMWQDMRIKVLDYFPKDPGIPEDINAYLQSVEKIYVTDAYHSLSIEKYKVTPELIERVRSGAWNSENSEAYKQQREAMAAKGYWEAFKAVEQSIARILEGANAGEIADQEHSDWYRELFGPSVTAGLVKPSELAGYRNDQVYISQSKHTPFSKEAVREAMPELFDMLRTEEMGSVRAIMGHFIFVYIHPYMDGNGRMARFLMNLMLASGGFPWTVIPVEERDAYMQALERASVNQDIIPFAEFIGRLVREGLKGTPVAKI